MMAARYEREQLRDVLTSRAIETFFAKAIHPKLVEWRRALLTNRDLPEDERRSLVMAYALMHDLFVDLYRTETLEPPEWIERAFIGYE